jgi:hypothetical protein
MPSASTLYAENSWPPIPAPPVSATSPATWAFGTQANFLPPTCASAAGCLQKR